MTIIQGSDMQDADFCVPAFNLILSSKKVSI